MRLLVADHDRGRAKAISENIDAAERQRKEADKLLEEYRARLKEAREQAEDIVTRARKAGDALKAEATEEGRDKREALLEAAKRDIEAAPLPGADPQGGRRPHRPRDREGDPQVARRRRPQTPGGRGPRRGRFLRPIGKRT